jgi:hypothetical protein
MAVGYLPFVVCLAQDGAGQAQEYSGLGKTPTTSLRRLISLFSRSSRLVDQIFCQCAMEGR